MVVRDHICVAVFGLVDLQVRVFPGELLAGVDRLREKQQIDAHHNIGGIFSSVLEGNGKRVHCNAGKLKQSIAVLNKS